MADTDHHPGLVRTSTLMRRLFKAPDLDSFINENAVHFQEQPLSSYLSELCQKTGAVRNQIILRSGIERSFGHQIFRGVRNPSRDIVLRLAFALGLNVEGTQRLLAAAQKSQLFPRIRRDAVLLYCLHNNLGITQTQTILEELKLPLLDGEAKDE